eukprot:CAMPEP_0180165200 /NCGR_PEP_ID=MMETSP0986-20121125/30835_1 /TAXON_ID=697907 /ORGANISM="non described non described, Strain CCMP2293" /LENGTH=54 /DNA_ID=CAMNT_0022116145 /DNA_START=131 /DNA_END=291 /DNA_ORIENTATION=+
MPLSSATVCWAAKSTSFCDQPPADMTQRAADRRHVVPKKFKAPGRPEKALAAGG